MGAVGMWPELEESQIDEDVPAHKHTTVMLDEAVEVLAPRAGAVYVDATLGAGGHTEGLLQAAPGVMVVGIDRDPAAILAASVRLRGFGERFMALRGSFGEMAELLAAAGIARVDGIVADLGISSAQLADAQRGMSFRREGPLDMRMAPDAPETALDIIERLDQDDLA
ncbi:MAG: 16S rRNA (cytosine(1402)-N(4))-methyltransferase, partial [Polyangiaceae bacterium]|nr:16S rRNA (cytosine(1402)-N(4))-methyltransferase [Polyangiaceae bacterium]